MKKTVLFLIIVLAFAAVWAFGLYKGVYLPPPTRVHDLNISIVSLPTAFTDVYKERTGTVVFDRAHENAYNISEVSELILRILLRGHTVDFLTEEEKLSEKLEEATAFVTVSPTKEFTGDEIKELKNFTGRILLLADPDRKSKAAELALGLGLVLRTDSYLYNLRENDGNFKYVFFTNFSENRVTQNLTKVTLYTACPVFPIKHRLLFPSQGTKASGKFLSEPFTAAALKGKTLVICDQTFLRDSYNRFTDNALFIANIASWLTGT